MYLAPLEFRRLFNQDDIRFNLLADGKVISSNEDRNLSFVVLKYLCVTKVTAVAIFLNFVY